MEANGQRAAIEDEADVIRTMSRVEPLRIVSGASESGTEMRGVTLVVSPLVVRLPLEGVVDLDAEGERLRAELADCDRNLERVEKLGLQPQLPRKGPPRRGRERGGPPRRPPRTKAAPRRNPAATEPLATPPGLWSEQTMPQRLGIIGHPIGHSISPVFPAGCPRRYRIRRHLPAVGRLS